MLKTFWETQTYTDKRKHSSSLNTEEPINQGTTVREVEEFMLCEASVLLAQNIFAQCRLALRNFQEDPRQGQSLSKGPCEPDKPKAKKATELYVHFSLWYVR